MPYPSIFVLSNRHFFRDNEPTSELAVTRDPLFYSNLKKSGYAFLIGSQLIYHLYRLGNSSRYMGIFSILLCLVFLFTSYINFSKFKGFKSKIYGTNSCLKFFAEKYNASLKEILKLILIESNVRLMISKWLQLPKR